MQDNLLHKILFEIDYKASYQAISCLLNKIKRYRLRPAMCLSYISFQRLCDGIFLVFSLFNVYNSTIAFETCMKITGMRPMYSKCSKDIYSELIETNQGNGMKAKLF